MHFSILLASAMPVLLSASMATAATEINNSITIANSRVTDASAKKIVRAVASETLKTISTKDSVPADVPMVEKLEDGEPSLPAKVFVEDAPGVRTPAAEPASIEGPVAPVDKKAAPATPAHGASTDGVPAEKAMLWLQNGNKRYLKKGNRSDGKSQADRDRLKKTEKPYAVVLSCSDSRVPPETVFDQALGEVFVVRTAGESLDAAVIASLEYAVENLGPRLLVVMGHTSCGAVSAALATADGKSAGSESLDLLVADIRPRLANRGPAGVVSESLEIESAANAQGVAADLMKRSSLIRARVEKGELVIKPALYYLDSGVVKFY